MAAPSPPTNLTIGETPLAIKTFTWTAPTTRTDGSPITGALTYRLVDTNVLPESVLADNIVGESVQLDLPEGSYRVGVYAIEDGRESIKSNLVMFDIVIVPANPNPPTGLTVS